MSEDHHSDLKNFQDQINSTQDAKLKATVSAGQKVMAAHTQMAADLAHKLGS